MQVSVIIPTHNRSDALEKTLEHLAYQEFAEKWEIVVINNNCTDNTDEVVELAKRNLSIPVTLVHEKTPGAAATRNTGAIAAKGEYLVFIDNDILTERDFLQRHFDSLNQNKHSWIVGQVSSLPEQEDSVFGKYRKTLLPLLSKSDSIREIDGITGANLSMPRRHFLELGGFDERFYVASGEDHEFAMRAREKLGIRTLLSPGIVVVHNDWAGSTIKDFCLRQHMYSQTEYYFWQKYGDNHPRLQLVIENMPANRKKDSPLLYCRKIIKRILSLSGTQFLLISVCSILEKTLPYPLVLWRLYKAAIAGAIYGGFQEGRKKFSEMDIDVGTRF